MVYTIKHVGRYAYVYHPPTEAECDRYIGNGYNPPSLVNERDPAIYNYTRGWNNTPAHYPVPATADNAMIANAVQDAECEHWWFKYGN